MFTPLTRMFHIKHHLWLKRPRGADRFPDDRFARSNEIFKGESRPARQMEVLTVYLWDVNEGSNAGGTVSSGLRGAPAEIIAEITAGIVRERGRQPG